MFKDPPNQCYGIGEDSDIPGKLKKLSPMFFSSLSLTEKMYIIQLQNGINGSKNSLSSLGDSLEVSNPFSSKKEGYESLLIPLNGLRGSDQAFQSIGQSNVYLDDEILRKEVSNAQNYVETTS